jgi:hypothetical protein
MFPFATSMRLYELTAEAFDDRAVGLSIAIEAEPRDYGLIGLLWAHQPTLDAGFDALARYYTAFLAGCAIEIRREPGRTRVISLFEHDHPGLDIFRPELLASVFLHSRRTAGQDWSPLEVHLTVPEVAPERFRAVFGVDVRFGAPVDQLVLDPAPLCQPIPGADPLLLAHLVEAAETHLGRRRLASGAQARLLRLRGCTVDLDTGTVTRGNETVTLTTKEKALLEYFAERRNDVVTHDDLERDVWGIGRSVLTHAPAVAIRRLRQKIEPPGRKPVNLVTVFGEGWRLVTPEPSSP